MVAKIFIVKRVLASTGDHYKELLNPMPSLREAVPEISGVLESISMADMIMVVRNLHSGKAAGVDEIWPEIFKALTGWGHL